MGTAYSSYISQPDTMPVFDKPPTFDPLYGFANGRKERVMVATQEEMEAAAVPMDKRDYCAHKYIKLMECHREKFPWASRCLPVKHEYEHCEYEDWVLRMKEHERERRLLKRSKRKRESAQSEAMDD